MIEVNDLLKFREFYMYLKEICDIQGIRVFEENYEGHLETIVLEYLQPYVYSVWALRDIMQDVIYECLEKVREIEKRHGIKAEKLRRTLEAILAYFRALDDYCGAAGILLALACSGVKINVEPRVVFAENILEIEINGV